MEDRKDIDIKNYIIELRKTLLQLSNAVEDSVPYERFSWNNYIPASYEHRDKVQAIIDEIKNIAKSYGLYFVDVYMHSDCEAVFDTEDLLGKSYTMDEIRNFSKQKISYSMYPDLRYKKEEVIKCPLCNKRRKSHVINEGYVIIGEDSIAYMLKNIICALFEALDNCKYKGKRSKIREEIYKTIIEVDNILLEKLAND